jgi:hypothetical protein
MVAVTGVRASLDRAPPVAVVSVARMPSWPVRAWRSPVVPTEVTAGGNASTGAADPMRVAMVATEGTPGTPAISAPGQKSALEVTAT